MSSLKQTIAPVTALFVSVAILLMGNGLQGTLIPVRAKFEAFSDIDIGLLGSFYYVGFTLGCFAGPYLISRAGHIRTYLGLVSVASAMALVHSLIVDPYVWCVLRGVTGFCFAALYVIIESWINERTDNSTRGTVFSIYTVINLTVITIGQMMLNFADPRSFPLFAMTSILISLASVPLAMTRAQSPDPIPILKPRIKRLFILSPVGFVGCFTHGLASGSFWSLGPVFALQSGLDTFGVSVFMSATVLGGACGQYPLGRISDRIDRRIVLVVTCGLAVVSALALTYFSGGVLWRVCAFGFLYGMFSFPVYALAVAHANDFASREDFVETSSGLLLVLGVGCIIGPVVAALAKEIGGFQVLFVFIAVVYFILALFTLQRLVSRKPVPQSEKVEFKDALVAARTVAPIEVQDGDSVSATAGNGAGAQRGS